MTAVGAVEKRRRFSKARWARLRVHGADSVHGLRAGCQPCGSRREGPSMRTVWH
jgi:hypothetical protein